MGTQPCVGPEPMTYFLNEWTFLSICFLYIASSIAFKTCEAVHLRKSVCVPTCAYTHMHTHRQAGRQAHTCNTLMCTLPRNLLQWLLFLPGRAHTKCQHKKHSSLQPLHSVFFSCPYSFIQGSIALVNEPCF